MYQHTHRDFTARIDWPDGGCYLSQLLIVIEVFEIIADEIAQYRKEQRQCQTT